MDFENVFNVIIAAFEEQEIQYALIGGFVLGAFGIIRSTIDLDFLILADNLDKVDKILKKSMYICSYKSENVSQYTSDLKPFGQIDILHAFRKYSLAVLKRAQSILVFNKYKIKVAIPEDIIGLKLQALKNDETREESEYSDIELLLKHLNDNNISIKWALLENYFKLFDLEDKFIYFKKRYK